MFRCALSLIILSFCLVAKSQTLDWHVSAQAGTANYHFENYQGSVLAGFKTQSGQMLSLGPVFKGYNMNSQYQNVMGGRIYSQARMAGGLSFYLQCDVFGRSPANSFTPTSATSTMRLETGAGIIYTFKETIGLSAGYNLGELNPINGIRKNTPAVKLIYLLPFGARGW
jgi:hypothetical protein